MKINKIAENLYYMGGPFFVFYIVTGTEKTALIELGISQIVPQALSDIKEGLGGRVPDILIAPHGHFDHAGACARWKKELPAAILCGASQAADALADEQNLPAYLRSMQSVTANPFFKHTFPLAEDEAFIEPVVFDRILKEGDTIDLGGETLEVIETPGHSACSLSLYHAPDKTLFVSDACGLPLSSGRIWPSAFMDGKLYIESIRKLMLREAEHICPGHNVPMNGADRNRRFLVKNIEAAEKFFERLEKLWAESHDRDAVLKSLYEEYKDEFTPPMLFVLKYGNKEMARQVIDGVRGRG
jgi:2-aminobenzoylacetyl-CoA thioesterase